MRRSSSKYSSPRSASSRSSPPSSKFSLSYATMALLGCIFVLGIAIGIILTSTTNADPVSIDSTLEIDRSAPNPELCQQFGASAIVSNLRVFITLNPFNVFVTQPVMQPGCVLRRNNWAILEKQNLVSSEQVRDCKNRMNTFAFTGPLEGSPNIECVYQNNNAGNLFINKPGAVAPIPESDNF